MKIVQEFKQFALRGNVMDLAVGVIIGGAFGKIVSSLVADVIMPPLGMVLGGVNFTSLSITLREANAVSPAILLKYGMFIQATVDFIIVAGAIFLAVKAINMMKRKEEQSPSTPATPPADVVLLTEIRDLLKRK
jgi:large conductance mechanosensitive channel